MANIETATKFFKLKNISSIEVNYSFTLVIYFFSSVSLKFQRKAIILRGGSRVRSLMQMTKSYFLPMKC